MSPNGHVAPISVDAYSLRLRAALRGLPDSEIEEILREIRGHILERQEGEGDSERLLKILRELGSPEDIGALYRTEALVARARTTFSPALIFGSAYRGNYGATALDASICASASRGTIHEGQVNAPSRGQWQLLQFRREPTLA